MMTESGLATQMAHFFVDRLERAHVPGDGRNLLGPSRSVHSVGGGQMADRGAVHARSRQIAQVHLGWVVQTYNATEALANLIHPFWMLPLVGILGLKARDIVGYSMLQFVVHVPLVLFLVWILNYTLTYVPPVFRESGP